MRDCGFETTFYFACPGAYKITCSWSLNDKNLHLSKRHLIFPSTLCLAFWSWNISKTWLSILVYTKTSKIFQHSSPPNSSAISSRPQRISSGSVLQVIDSKNHEVMKSKALTQKKAEKLSNIVHVTRTPMWMIRSSRSRTFIVEYHRLGNN